jgi:NAD(P)-dependent dehydrogenase (short-subunit alcohol dehydrogenase family)
MADKARARVAVVTGASSGIGLETAKALAAKGWRVIGTGRDPGRSAAALAEISAAATGPAPEMILADLSLISGAARLADEVAARTEVIDVLANNAGGVAAERHVTSEGHEATFTGNHLGHFLLTERLLPQLRAAAADQPKGEVRVLNTSSSAHEVSRGFNWNDLQSLETYVSVLAYANAKLANILFTRVLARRLAADGIVAHAMHPGMVDTNFASYGDQAMQTYFEANKAKAITPATAADTLVWLAVDPEPGRTSGGYFHNRAPMTPSAAAQDDEAAERLWRESEMLIAEAGV